MRGLDDLNVRLRRLGGNAEQRFQKSKLHSLEMSLKYSYQAETIVLADGREFRALMNTDSIKPNYDNRIISIPFVGIRLNPEQGTVGHGREVFEEIGLKTGDLITWKKYNTKWLVFLRYLQEDSYFRAEIRRCDQQMELDGEKYWCYTRGPVETALQWENTSGIVANKMNYSLDVYVTKDEFTTSKIHRFTKIKMYEENSDICKTWRVTAVNPYFGDNIIEFSAEEFFENELEEKEIERLNSLETQTEIDESLPHIVGDKVIRPFEYIEYSIANAAGGKWYVVQDGKEFYMGDSDKIVIEITQRKVKNILVIYRIDGQNDITLDVSVSSF